MAWQNVGTVTFSPFTERAVVGPVRVPRSGGMQVRVRLESAAPFQFGYCLLSYESVNGRELGTIRVWPRAESTSYRLGEGLEPIDTTGVLVLEPRTWNLRWVRAGFSLTVSVQADAIGSIPEDRYPAEGFSRPDGTPLLLTPSGGRGRITF